jgi:hypothetical protein
VITASTSASLIARLSRARLSHEPVQALARNAPAPLRDRVACTPTRAAISPGRSPSAASNTTFEPCASPCAVVVRHSPSQRSLAPSSVSVRGSLAQNRVPGDRQVRVVVPTPPAAVVVHDRPRDQRVMRDHK